MPDKSLDNDVLNIVVTLNEIIPDLELKRQKAIQNNDRHLKSYYSGRMDAFSSVLEMLGRRGYSLEMHKKTPPSTAVGNKNNI